MTDPGGVTGIVLAGGRSTRFGRPKLAVELDGVSLLERTIRALATASGEVLVAGPAVPELAPPLAVSLTGVPDPVDSGAFPGPLVALAGALRRATNPIALVVGGDMPLLVPSVLRAMTDRLANDPRLEAVFLGAPDRFPGPAGSTERAESTPAAEPTGRSSRQVLPLAVRVVHALDAAGAAIAAGDRSLVRLLDRLRSIEIPAPEWLPLDPTGSTLIDVDTPDDLVQIERRLLR